MSGDKGKVVAGVFIGMVLGITAAGGVAWYVLNKKSSFTNKEQAKVAAQVAALPASAPAVTAPLPASAVAEPKIQYEFYRELTDKSDGAGRRTTQKPAPKPREKPQVVATAPAPKDLYFVQAGSFQNVGDAEKLKAKLAFSGFEANIQEAAIPDKGVWHRVRLGPFSDGEAAKTISALKQNGIIATHLRAQ
ncbi:MAG: SPOR domain-containing protein [Sideroxyarcus sp.]|nr:SPOR domain-containing protein [Sideroxyarcus sp.]